MSESYLPGDGLSVHECVFAPLPIGTVSTGTSFPWLRLGLWRAPLCGLCDLGSALKSRSEVFTDSPPKAKLFALLLFIWESPAGLFMVIILRIFMVIFVSGAIGCPDLCSFCTFWRR